MARPLIHQGGCRIAQRQYVGAPRMVLTLPSASRCGQAESHRASLATQREEQACSTSGLDAAFQLGERSLASLNAPGAPSCSGSTAWGNRAAIFAAATGLSLLLVDAASANGGTLSGGAFELFKEFLDQVEAMGPAGGLVFVAVVMLSEMIPLFPTQPLSLASGLLFGGKQGAVLMLLGVTLAAVNAFIISRGVGRPLAEKVISMEMSEASDDSPSAASHNAVARKLAEVQRVIETGSFWQQLIAVALLRLTPVVPFSASNYVLGLTPLQLPAFLGGTVAGMSVWAVLYASLGGAGRSLLDSGVDMGTVFAELAERSGTYTRPILLAGGGLAAAGALVFLVSRQLGAARGGDASGSDSEGEGGGDATAGAKRASGGAAGSGSGGDDRELLMREEQLLRK
ncbi:hypothetical protein PLESTB_000719100 [Pleodorina starrii]|uniref:VTT domain-containing protein n=1 Tax=Pleodorina starrii TaxID=330485 RepID=A0A9W6BJ72_9CHLO|nr:hypothetical protein PLESTM_001708400 [Pleodorina starrii]GLC53201.1 hypothetical protein PLESTB_000719100 [Pleodorina starrii]GLC68656.1 hypothetical protein PLESTF_000719700 [Pleodorina starrii]